MCRDTLSFLLYSLVVFTMLFIKTSTTFSHFIKVLTLVKETSGKKGKESKGKEGKGKGYTAPKKLEGGIAEVQAESKKSLYCWHADCSHLYLVS